MNRILKRPMFRLGGSAEGITSGLDAPNINASRQDYDNGGDVNPLEGNTQMILDAYEKFSGEPEKKEAMAPGSLSSFLTNFSLNLAGQPGGNLMGAIGKAGSPALKQFQQARMMERREKDQERKRDVRDAVSTSASIYETAIKAAAEGKDKGFEFQSKQNTLMNLQDKERNIMKQIEDAQGGAAGGANNEEAIAELEQDLQDNAELQKLITKEEDVIGKMILASIASQGPKSEGGYFEIEDYLEWKKNKKMPGTENKATGGRVGLQLGGQPEPLMGEMVEEIEETGSTDVAEDLTYNELRSRLPREITNDVVQLIATSKQALVDFANIRTQQDVDSFNQSYNVDLVLPQEG